MAWAVGTCAQTINTRGGLILSTLVKCRLVVQVEPELSLHNREIKAQGTASEESRAKEREGDRYVSWTLREWLKEPLAQVFSASRSGNVWIKEGIHWLKKE